MATIDLFGAVGDPWEDGFTAPQVAEMLKENDGDLTVRINSPGGFAFDGVAIYNMLADRKPKVEIVGLAASAASVIAMAGSEIVMRRGSRMMIHDAWGFTMGPEDEHRKAADELSGLSDALAEIYAERTGGTAAEMRALMKEETWMSGSDAVKRGFATSTFAEDADQPPEDAQAVLATMQCKHNLQETEAARRREENRRAFVRWQVKNRLTQTRVIA